MRRGMRNDVDIIVTRSGKLPGPPPAVVRGSAKLNRLSFKENRRLFDGKASLIIAYLPPAYLDGHRSAFDATDHVTVMRFPSDKTSYYCSAT